MYEDIIEINFPNGIELESYALVDDYSMVVKYSINLLLIITALIVVNVIIKLILTGVRKKLIENKVNDIVVDITLGFVRYLTFLIILFGVLDISSVDKLPAVAVLCAVGLAIVVDLQHLLSNFSTSALIMCSRLFKSGNYVVTADIGGIVSSIKRLYYRIRMN